MLLKRQTWRDFYNPIRGLTMARLVAMEDQAERGQHADLQWFYHHMERSDVTIMSAIARRLAFIESLDWEIRAVENADPVLAAEQADLLRYAYDRIANFKEAAAFLAGAIFRGFAHVEKVYTGYGNLVSRLEPVEQWFWVRPVPQSAWRFNSESRPHESAGQIVDRRHFCVMESLPLHRAIGRHFFSKQLALADWDVALETSANPSIFFVGPPGVSPEKELEYKSVAEQIASNGRGYLPNGTEVETVDTAQRSRLPFQERIDYCDRQIVLAATGGLLTMLTESGSGTLAGGAHTDSLVALAKSDAARLSEVFQRDLDAEWLARFFPHQPHVAYFSFEVPQREDVPQLLENVANLNWAGYRVDMAQLEEKTGLKLMEAPPPQ
jgi:phage gp29-like protein